MLVAAPSPLMSMKPHTLYFITNLMVSHLTLNFIIEGLLNPRMKRLVLAGQIQNDNTKVGPGAYNVIDDALRKSPRVMHFMPSQFL